MFFPVSLLFYVSAVWFVCTVPEANSQFQLSDVLSALGGLFNNTNATSTQPPAKQPPPQKQPQQPTPPQTSSPVFVFPNYGQARPFIPNYGSVTPTFFPNYGSAPFFPNYGVAPVVASTNPVTNSASNVNDIVINAANNGTNTNGNQAKGLAG